MNNNEFMKQKEESKKTKLVSVIGAKVPSIEKEDLVKIVSALNLKRQYNIRVIKDKKHITQLATEENIKHNEDINGIQWETITTSTLNVIIGEITPGSYENINGEEKYIDTVAKIKDGAVVAFTKENHNLGFLDVNRPEYENFLYLYAD